MGNFLRHMLKRSWTRYLGLVNPPVGSITNCFHWVFEKFICLSDCPIILRTTIGYTWLFRINVLVQFAQKVKKQYVTSMSTFCKLVCKKTYVTSMSTLWKLVFRLMHFVRGSSWSGSYLLASKDALSHRDQSTWLLLSIALCIALRTGLPV